MDKLILYHGSDKKVSKPTLDDYNPLRDFGRGFYTTASYELGAMWANSEPIKPGIINKYELNINKLRILDVRDNILGWIALVLINRNLGLANGLPRLARKYILNNYSIDLSGYDIVIGYRADDSYFSLIKLFLNNTISIEALEATIIKAKLGYSIALISDRAINSLSFIGSEATNDSKYYYKSRKKELEAFSILDKMPTLTGSFIKDILRGNIHE